MSTPAGMDLDWARTTGGALSSRQRRQLLSPLMRTIVADTVGRLRRATGRRGNGGVDLDSLRWPDSQLAKDAEEEAREVLSPHVREHSYRTYLFGLSLAALDGKRIDEELGYVASLLHDLELEHRTPGRCFAVVGAERAERFVLDRDGDPQRASWVAEAVAGHLTPGEAEDLGRPAGFVSAGALLDVAGVRYDELDPRWVERVLERHPRHDFKRHLRVAFAEESAVVPEGRSRFLTRYAMFPLLIRASPFAE